MDSIVQNVKITEKRHGKYIPWLLLVGLLFLRFPLWAGINLVFKDSPDWLMVSYQTGTYWLTILLIWCERNRLADFYIDKLSLIIIIFLKPIQTVILAILGINSAFAFPHWASLIIWVTSGSFLIVFWLSHSDLPKIQAANWRWLGIGIGVGIATAIFLGYPMSLQVDKNQLRFLPYLSDYPVILIQAVPDFFFQLGYAAVSEEPLFRGFLWGYLRKIGWKNVWIWLFQAGLFTLGHIYYFYTHPISFWVIVPISALILGLMAWRSRSIATSMAAHAALNALGMTIGFIFVSFQN